MLPVAEVEQVAGAEIAAGAVGRRHGVEPHQRFATVDDDGGNGARREVLDDVLALHGEKQVAGGAVVGFEPRHARGGGVGHRQCQAEFARPLLHAALDRQHEFAGAAVGHIEFGDDGGGAGDAADVVQALGRRLDARAHVDRDSRRAAQRPRGGADRDAHRLGDVAQGDAAGGRRSCGAFARGRAVSGHRMGLLACAAAVATGAVSRRSVERPAVSCQLICHLRC